jgi:hypothetical protein
MYDEPGVCVHIGGFAAVIHKRFVFCRHASYDRPLGIFVVWFEHMSVRVCPSEEFFAPLSILLYFRQYLSLRDNLCLAISPSASVFINLGSRHIRSDWVLGHLGERDEQVR